MSTMALEAIDLTDLDLFADGNLARREIRVMLTELFDTFRTFEVVGPPEWTRSNRHIPMRLVR